MVRVIQAPEEFAETGESIFLAGGISDCRDWQDDMIEMLDSFDGTILNPRREVWPTWGADLDHQVGWERRHLAVATLRLFWFTSETVCPITLFELGQTIGSSRPFVVGTHPAYGRRENVIIQTRLATPGVRVVSSLEELADSAMAWSEAEKVVA